MSKARAVAGRVQVFDITVREWRCPAEVYQVTMTDQQKRDRIGAIEVELKYHNRRQLPPYKRQALLHEALDLCTAVGLDERWRIFKRRLEALQQGEVQRLKAEGGRPARKGKDQALDDLR